MLKLALWNVLFFLLMRVHTWERRSYVNFHGFLYVIVFLILSWIMFLRSRMERRQIIYLQSLFLSRNLIHTTQGDACTITLLRTSRLRFKLVFSSLPLGNGTICRMKLKEQAPCLVFGKNWNNTFCRATDSLRLGVLNWSFYCIFVMHFLPRYCMLVLIINIFFLFSLRTLMEISR